MPRRVVRWLPLLFVAALAALAGIGRAALEAPPGDPLVTGRAGFNPAAVTARPVAGGPLLFDRPRRAGLSLFAARWESLPDLRRDGVVVWMPIASSLAMISGRRLALVGYSETELGFDWCHPPRHPRGWGWAVGLARAGWQVDPGAGAVLRWSAGLGLQPSPGARLAIRLIDEAGGRGLTPAQAQLGLSFDIDRAWRAGLSFDRIDDGAWRLRAEVEAFAGRDLAMTAGLEPASGTVAFGLSLRRGPIGVDVGRLDHPRVGVVSSAGLSIGGGGAP